MYKKMILMMAFIALVGFLILIQTTQSFAQPAPTDDYGDAPDPNYPTLLASNGARHSQSGTPVFLGANADTDLDGQPDATATGDDLDGNNDDDGVVFTSALVAGNSANVNVTLGGVFPCTLSAWIDFNADGDWADTGEDLFPGGQPLVLGLNSLSFSVPASAGTGNTFARFRATTDGAVTYTGFASDGEVEDYMVLIEGPSIDFGDAPDPTYPTLLASNGARHSLSGTPVFLGASVDNDPDGQPDATATGDDTDGNNDDDGVVFTSALIPGNSANVNVMVGGVFPCTLSAWIDFNADGDWADAGEDLFPGGQTLVLGLNSVSFSVPASANVGNTFARFRATTDGAVTYTGLASDGEVEDYQVDIVAPGTIIVEKQTVPDAYPGTFTFTGDAAGIINDNGTITVAGLAPGTYTSTETVPANWALTSIVCVENGSPNSSGSIITGAVTFVLEPGETCTCTFNNTALAGIGNRVWEDLNNDGIQNAGEPGLPNVTVNLYDMGTATLATTTTNASGSYSFINLMPGNYSLEFILPPAFNFSPADQGGDDNLDSDANVITGMTTLTALSAGEFDDTWDAGMWEFAVGVSGDSADAGGAIKDFYTPDEIVYAIGSGFSPFGDVWIHVVPDRAWTDGDPIGPDISDDGINIVAAGTTGNIGPVPVWNPPLDVGDYDIVFDADRDGFYDDGIEGAIDAVDDPNHPGFIVRQPSIGGGGPTVGGQVMLVNKVQLVRQLIALPLQLMWLVL